MELIEENSLVNELSLTGGIADAVTKVLNSLIEKTKCTLDVIQEVIDETKDGGQLGSVYKKYRADIEAVLKAGVEQCKQENGLTQKLK